MWPGIGQNHMHLHIYTVGDWDCILIPVLKGRCVLGMRLGVSDLGPGNKAGCELSYTSHFFHPQSPSCPS